MNDLLTPREAAKMLGINVEDLKTEDGDWRIDTLRRGNRVYMTPWDIERQRENWDMHLALFPPGWPKRK